VDEYFILWAKLPSWPLTVCCVTHDLHSKHQRTSHLPDSYIFFRQVRTEWSLKLNLFQWPCASIHLYGGPYRTYGFFCNPDFFYTMRFFFI
jgi:hypothetical protein